jgi:signal transduction histidine kinase
MAIDVGSLLGGGATPGVNPSSPSPLATPVMSDDPIGIPVDDVTAIADLASQMLLADKIEDRLRLAAYGVRSHLDRPVAAFDRSGSLDHAVVMGVPDAGRDRLVRAAASLAERRCPAGTVVRASVDGLSLALVHAGTGWVAVVDTPDGHHRYLEAVGNVVATALASANATSDDVEMTLMWSAHELRSPLVTVRTAIEQAMQSKQASERRLLLEGGLRELEMLSAVTESLLRFRPDGMASDGRAVDLGMLVSEMLAEDTETRRVESRCDPGVWAFVDPVQFRIAVMNLVRNAQAHTEDGNVVVRVFRDGDRSVVSVEDRGEGVAPELRDRIFDPYVRGQGSRGGSGLGLHICKRIIEGHGGNVTIQEREGGTVFVIDVPWNDQGGDGSSAS